MKQFFFSICLLILVPAFALGQSSNQKVEEEILKLEQELLQAMDKSDQPVLEKLVAEDFAATWLIPPQIKTKAEFRTLLQAQKAMGAQPTEATTVEETKVRVYGDTAIFTARWKQSRKRADGSSGTASGRETHTWVKLNGRWQIVASHASPDLDLSKCR